MLTEEEQSQILDYMGWPAATSLDDNVFTNSYTKQWIFGLEYNDSMLAIIRNYLTWIADIDTKLRDAESRLTANELEGISLNPNELSKLEQRRLKLIRRLRKYLNFPRYR